MAMTQDLVVHEFDQTSGQPKLSINAGLEFQEGDRVADIGGVPVHYRDRFQRSINDGLHDDNDFINRMRRQYVNIKL